MYSLNERCVHMSYLCFLARLAILTNKTSPLSSFIVFFFLFYFLNIYDSQDSRETGSLSLKLLSSTSSVSQTLRNQTGYYCRKLTSTHSQQLDLNREPLFSECKKLITKIRVELRYNGFKQSCVICSQEHLRDT